MSDERFTASRIAGPGLRATMAREAAARPRKAVATK
jgi:hypothetical protein